MASDVVIVRVPQVSATERRAWPPLRERLAPPLPSRGLAGWVGPLAILLLGGYLRFRNLGEPRTLVFDETYYAKDAWSLLRTGYEHSWPDKADAAVVAGHPSFLDRASFVVHPPVGKWVIAVGEWLFGMNAFGWRFMLALLGTLSILLVARIARRLTRSDLLGVVAGLLLAVDGLHLVMSRTALLDGVLMFWLLAAFGCLLLDRDQTRARLAAIAERQPERLAGSGPRLGWRPWRIAAAVFLGLACATKWNGVWYLAGFAALVVLWDLGARRAAGVRHPCTRLVPDALTTGTVFFGIGLAVYLASWAGWFATDGGWDRRWADTHPAAGLATLIPDALRSLWHYHAAMWHFHTTLRASHPYMSHPWGWLVLARPVSYFYENQNVTGCGGDPCVREILALGTPALWWLAAAALPYLAWRALARRDWRASAVLLAVAAGWLPWFLYSERTIFYFYAAAFTPFLVLAATLTLGTILGPPVPGPRRTWGAITAGLLVLLVVLSFAYFHPLFVGDPLTTSEWNNRMWLRSWI
ncbi:dolichyl-phosphate-mannose--protein mannosyltransferase [Carbonactinospora thermoautotrophica]|uniref:dolichyl-phosphate-mannose--protein mannosyltransferase n=1 Tax=Carbonactinospora thermoautotrophica TaxID=1469144 RepID=UPI001E64EA3E|nr:phospholipid carrier-dependent glycosyltransferase [Carbonactinospora thermoautotrophica]